MDGEGLFGKESVLRRVVRESIGLLGGGRSLLMQIAHPMVAAGVADHSNFQSDPLGRLERTMDITLGIVLGDRDHAEEVLRRFHRIHGRIKGQLRHDAGPFHAGTEYLAHDPALKLWVHATLIDTSLMVYQRFVRRLSPRDQHRYYQDSMLLARRFGIPERMIPASFEEFTVYMDEMVHGDALVVTETTRTIAREVLYPNVWIVPRSAGPVARFVTAGLLPEPLREAYGFKWSDGRQLLLDQFSRTMRLMLPFTPRSVRLVPQAGGGELIELAIRGGRRHR
jgi:uncharacterized protein (DUF2236 family)